MRFTDVIIFLVTLGVFSPVFAGEISALRKMDCRIEELREENDSLSFISESFYKTCEGRGFSSLEEWETVCKKLWQLESIEWEYVRSLDTRNEENDTQLLCGTWYRCEGVKKIYCRKRSPFGA